MSVIRHWDYQFAHLSRWVPLVEQELLTLSENMCSHPVFIGVRVTRSLVLWVCFVDRFSPFVLLWPLCCLCFINLWITPLKSSNSSFTVFLFFLTIPNLRIKHHGNYFIRWTIKLEHIKEQVRPGKPPIEAL